MAGGGEEGEEDNGGGDDDEAEAPFGFMLLCLISVVVLIKSFSVTRSESQMMCCHSAEQNEREKEGKEEGK